MSDKDLLVIPKFDGDYEHWAMLMENLIRSKEWWDLIENGIPTQERGTVLSGAQRAELLEKVAAKTVIDHKVKNYLFASIDKTILKTILKKETSKEIWESMKKKFQGNERVQSAQLQRQRRNFEILEMRAGETVAEYFSRVMEVANDMRNLGEDMPDSKIVEKILRTLAEKFTYIVCAIEESKDIGNMTVDALQSSLMVHEQNMTRYDGDERALKVEGQWRPTIGREKGGSPSKGRGRGGYQGRGRGSFNKEKIECFKCHKMGHFRSECPDWEKEANYVEMEEDLLLMARIESLKTDEEHVWFLDSGCSNHMCGAKEWFIELDEAFNRNVKLGDDSRMSVNGKGRLRLEINGRVQYITDVYYVPGLKNNLLSVGQLQEKGLRIIIENGGCEVWHKQERKLIMHSTMSKNRMFIILAAVRKAKEVEKEQCLQVMEKTNELWHRRYGHLNNKGLRCLAEKELVVGIPKLSQEIEEVICDICMRGKQNREIIPKKSEWKSSRRLQLVHTDICGPITPISESGKRYIINFIDDYSRKCWTYFLTEKSEAFKTFKEFKAAAERETGHLLAYLRSDRGGEYNSREFDEYCRDSGIKRQLTAAYTPQQNGVAERKNRTVMNMTRCMMLEMNVPRRFWPEAVQYAVYILNRSPSKALEDITPEEKWSNHKPSVEHLKVFGSVAYALVPYERRIKLDEKSIRCVLFGVSRESKAYRLYNPETKKIIISRDVHVDENTRWDWDGKEEEKELVWDDYEDETNEEKTAAVADENAGTAPEETQPEGDNGVAEEVAPNAAAQTSVRGDRRRTIRRPVWFKDFDTRDAGFLVEEEQGEVYAIFISMEDPEVFEEAAKLEVWRLAMEKEIASIEENCTWELVDPPEGIKVIGVKWVFKTKLNENGEVDKFKARLVAKGYHQKQGVDFHEVFAPVARWDTVRVILSIAAEKGWNVFQLDVKSAFLHGELMEEVYVEQPKGFVVNGEEEKVYKLKKALYGLKQAPRAWYSRIEKFFLQEGFEKCYCEHTLFVKKEKESCLIVSLYVDDLIYTGNSTEMLQQFKESMMEEFSMTDLGKMRYFLGVEVIQDEKGIFINQKKYAGEILEKYGMEECNSVRNPMVPGNKLTKTGAGDEVNPTTYKQLVGSLRYLTATRPDLIYSVNLVSRYMESPTEQHMMATKRILRYIQGTRDFGIQYKVGGEQKLIGYVDSDYAGDMDDCKSTSGYVFLLGGAAVSWASKKQPIVTLSTTEAEFVSAAFSACQVVWIRNIMKEIGFQQQEGTTLFCDNSSTIKLSRNPVMHGRSKHIHVRFHYLRDLVNEGVIQLSYCATQEQIADVMTKAVKLDVFEKLRSMMGVCVKDE